MNLNDINGITTAELARSYAIDWQHDFDNNSYSYNELADWQAFFEQLADKFNLYEEYKENGVI